MLSFPRSSRFTLLLDAFNEVERERFWDATGIDVNDKKVDREKFGYFKNSLVSYQDFLRKSAGTLNQPPVEAKRQVVCESCGLPDENEIYMSVPKCVRFCVRCTEELIQDVERVE
jgi:hypothetical protein